jgi:tyrosine decarboxylase/aspartate 1-decarboxylase
MDEKGLSEKEVMRELLAKRKKDLTYARGRILSSMCTSPHPVVKKIYPLFLETNLGDPGLFEGTKELELEAVRILGKLLGHEKASGFILSGGTEANLTALWIARNRLKRSPPEVIVPESAHFSVDKAADLLGLRVVKAPLLPDHSVDVERVAELVSNKTVALIGIAGSTEYGAVDDIQALSEIALEEGLHLHVDAAFGGFVLPFMKELGYKVRLFDFSLRGVSSITVDPHKMGLAAIPGGALLLRTQDMLEAIETLSPYLTEKRQYTLTGTRSGAPASTVYALLKHLGREGYRRNVKQCMEVTLYLYDALGALGLEVVKPWMNILVIRDAGRGLQDELGRRGWVLSQTRRGEIRIVIMPHVTMQAARDLVEDVKEILRGNVSL